MDRPNELDRITIISILEIVQQYIEGSNPNGEGIARNTALVEEIYSRVNDELKRPTV